MEPILFIAGLTALHLAVVALIDLLTSSRPWRWKLGWGLVLLGLPLAGPVLYYLRGARRPERAPRRRVPTSKAEDGAGRRIEPDLAVPGSGREG